MERPPGCGRPGATVRHRLRAGRRVLGRHDAGCVRWRPVAVNRRSGMPRMPTPVSAGAYRDRRGSGVYVRRRDVLVLALPRGGVPVAYQVARPLDAPLDAVLVRKLGLPVR